MSILGYLPILIEGGYTNGIKGFVALWQLQNFDFVSRNGEIVNQINDKKYKKLLSYIKKELLLNTILESLIPIKIWYNIHELNILSILDSCEDKFILKMKLKLNFFYSIKQEFALG
jgi:mRNA interferase MazF